MSFLYPRTIVVRRPSAPTAVGAVAYQGVLPSAETVIAAGLPASIQQARSAADDTRLPADPRKTAWRIFVPRRALAKGAVRDGDVVVDDEGNRYQVGGAYWNSLGYRLTAELLKA